MKFLYTAKARFDKDYSEKDMNWYKYISWSGLTHLTELISLDGCSQSSNLVEPIYENDDDWNYIYKTDHYLTNLFTSLDFVFKRIKIREKFNLLTVVIEPEYDCKDICVEGFEFVGYELLETDFSYSALTNCGGFNKSFLPADLNDKGLIEDFAQAYKIKKSLLQNYPEVSHANTNLIAVWRHTTIGQ
jgi:hypothetical protein